MAISSNFYVYEHIRKDTGAIFYVGKGRGSRAKNFFNRGVYWDRVANKGGVEVRYAVKDVDEELSLLAEMEYIDVLRKRGIKLVNISDGGEGTTGWIPSEETKRKIGLANKTTPKAKGEEHGMYGKKHTEESLAKMSVSQKAREWGEKHPFYGKKHSEEIRLKISKNIEGKVQGEKNGFYGKTHTDETKRKISEAGKGRTASDETRAKLSASLKIALNKPEIKEKQRLNHLGKVNSPETRKKISEAKTGFKYTEESKKKMSESRKRYFARLKEQQQCQ